MESLNIVLDAYGDYITLAVLVLFLIAFFLFIAVVVSLNKTKKRYKTLLQGMDNKNLEEVILNNAAKISGLEENLADLEKKLSDANNILNRCIKNISLERYNAFQGIGGEQSFSLALLDDNGNGIILSSIHGREDARTYAKKIVAGKPMFNLSEEEKLVLSEALNKVDKYS